MGSYLSSYICGRIWCFLLWSVPKIIQIKVRDKLDPVNAWSQTIKSKKVTPNNISWLLYCTNSSISLLLPTYETSQSYWWLPAYWHYIYRDFFSLTPNTTCSVFSSFSLSVETPNHFQHFVSVVSCCVRYSAKRAITLNSASSKFRNDIIEK